MIAAEIRTLLAGTIGEQLGVSPARIVDVASFAQDLGADSLDMVGLAVAIEEAFDVELGDDEVAGLDTVADAVALLERKRAE